MRREPHGLKRFRIVSRAYCAAEDVADAAGFVAAGVLLPLAALLDDGVSQMAFLAASTCFCDAPDAAFVLGRTTGADSCGVGPAILPAGAAAIGA